MYPKEVLELGLVGEWNIPNQMPFPGKFCCLLESMKLWGWLCSNTGDCSDSHPCVHLHSKTVPAHWTPVWNQLSSAPPAFHSPQACSLHSNNQLSCFSFRLMLLHLSDVTKLYVLFFRVCLFSASSVKWKHGSFGEQRINPKLPWMFLYHHI